MSFPALLALALALAIDAFSVSLACGVGLPAVTRRHVFRLSFHFGLFQAGMTLAGWAAGTSVRDLIEAADHWVAFGLLGLVGGKMLLDAARGGSRGRTRAEDPTRGASLVILSVATSVDALSVGLGLALLGEPVLFPALVIGFMAAGLSALGVRLGRWAGRAAFLERWATAVGGLVLLGIGLGVLHDHGVFGGPVAP